MRIDGTKGPLDNPCVGVCSTTTGDEVCRGCGRTVFEIREWMSYSDTIKAHVIETCARRLRDGDEI